MKVVELVQKGACWKLGGGVRIGHLGLGISHDLLGGMLIEWEIVQAEGEGSAFLARRYWGVERGRVDIVVDATLI